jgi:rhodanese-related sulfurtransferase
MFAKSFFRTLACAACALVYTSASMAQTFDQSHAAFTAVLQRSVHWNAAGTATAVDYAAIKADPAALTAYTQSLSRVTQAQFDQMSKLQKRALLINAYNAFTLQLILTKYPNLKSIKELGSLLKSPWKQSFITFLGKQRSLDDIEHGLLRGAADFDDPRIHFAVNCASIGCPALRPEAFVAEKLDAQLLDQTQRFLRDRSRNYFAASENTLYISPIFKWYGEDFERGFLKADSVAAFLADYGGSLGLTQSVVAALKQDDVDLDYTDYDWKLNRHIAQSQSTREPQLKSRVHALYAEVAGKLSDVPVKTASELMQQRSQSIIVDVRPAAERTVSMLPGAITEVEFQSNYARTKQPVVVYCTIGYRSGLAARKLRASGLQAFNLQGGILAWIAEGGTISDPKGRTTRRVHVYGKSWAVVPKDYEAVF